MIINMLLEIEGKTWRFNGLQSNTWELRATKNGWLINESTGHVVIGIEEKQ